MFYTCLVMTDLVPAPVSHRDIIDRAGGPAALGRAIKVEANTTKAWKRVNSIPAPHWLALEAAGLATLSELAEGAAMRVAEEVPA